MEEMIEMDEIVDRQPWATYPIRDGNTVWFYNDACEDVKGEAGAFKDIQAAILEARHFVFICDWSFHPQVVLTRSVNPDDNWIFNLAEHLLQKAEHNPEMIIAIHAWNHAGDDKTSDEAGDYLATKDGNQERPSNLLWRATHRTGFLWSHHQKYVILDAPADDDSDKRQIKVFFGGLDLTRGRYDYPGHPIAGPEADRYYKNSSYDDWYNGEFGHDEALPREPWHDIHAGLTGPAAWDFIYEFVGRWNSGGGGSAWPFGIEGDPDKTHLVWQKFVELYHHDSIYNQAQTPATGPWTCQVYRSMEDKAWSPPPDPGRKTDLVALFKWQVKKSSGEAATYERSIQEAYVREIAKAEHYIYIETQYLIGSPVTHGKIIKNKNKNIIPIALVDRIKNKIAAGEPFHVYILMPMFPEGNPISLQTQPVRYWGQQTVQWMVDQVESDASEVGKSWKEYLSFYFLGQRSGDVEYDAGEVLKREERVAASNRYMIYVHSKMMIVDDNWIIIGSANLNERSMAGDRDTEICVGMWPTEDHEDAADCIQQVRDFRLKLWAEHLGENFVNDNRQAVVEAPGSAETAVLIQSAAVNNLRLFYQDVHDPAMNHLMAWPLYSGLSGGDYDYIPDYDAKKSKKHWLWNQTDHTIGGGDIRFL